MKKIILVLFILLITGCTNSSTLKIEGYWEQIERDWSGDVDDMREDPYAYLEITKDRMYYYTESSLEEGYYETKADKYYKLEGDQLYYDYYELTGSDWKDNLDELSGGVYTVTFEGDNLVLTVYYGETLEDGYNKNTYRKIDEKDRLLEQ